MPSVLTDATGKPFKLSNGYLSLSVPELGAITNWAHLYDAAAAVTYTDSSGSYSLPTAVRVASVPSSTSLLNLHKDTGAHGAVFAGAALPGPLFIASSQRFNGRPAWYSDTIMATQGFFDDLHSAMFQGDDPTNNDINLMGLTQPWWFATLIRTPNDKTGNELIALDGNLKCATVGGHLESETAPNNKWDLSAWHSLDGGAPGVGGFLQSEHGNSNNRTFLLIGQIYGVNSRFITAYRNSSGVLMVSDNTGTVNGTFNDQPSQQHIGWSYTNYGTFLGFQQGVLTEGEKNNLILWSARYMPAEAVIPIETS